ncbi:MAG: ABC transporter permease [Gemmatimonadaceae bacterium]
MDSLLRDVRFVARSFARSPGFFIVTALTLALGIGATTAIFSVVNGVLLRPLPYSRSDRIVQLFSVGKTGDLGSLSEPNFADWKAQARGFSSMAQFQSGITTVTGLAEPLRAQAAAVSREFFTVFAVAPELGRLFSDDELRRGARPTAVVSDQFWRMHLGADQGAIGKTVTIGPQLVTIVGVMPPQMNFPAGTDLWMPHEIDTPNPSRSSGGWRVVARLRDAVTAEQARQDLSTVSRRIRQIYGDDSWMTDSKLVPLHEQLVGNVRTTLFVLLGASAFLLLIACANVINLLVARMVVRRSELAVRMALGASRTRVVRQVLTESAVLALVGGTGGVALAAASIRVFVAMAAGKLPRANEVHLDTSVLAFALVMSAITALAIGMLAAWHGTRAEIRETLSSSQRTAAGSGSGTTIRRTLVVSQMALTVVLLVGAGVLARSFMRLMEVNPGFRTNHVVIVDPSIPYEDGAEAASRRVAFYRDAMDRLRSLPGVVNVGASNGVPLVGGGADGTFIVMTRPDEKITIDMYPILMKDPVRSGSANFMVVDGNYFDAMGVPIEVGRAFQSTDVESAAHVAVISASLAKAKWPNQDPIGKIIQYGNMDGDMRPFTVVGVVGDVRDQNLANPPQQTFYAYLPQRTHAAYNLRLVLQVAGDPTPVIASAQAIVRQLRPDLPVSVRTIETVVSTSVADRRFVLVLAGVFGGAALLLATLGVYSVVSYAVTQRRQEIGVRIALGARRADVLQLVLRQGATLAVAGIVVGGIGAFFLTTFLRGMVYGVSTTDPMAFSGVLLLLAGVALAASWIPARRAAGVDPMDVLRGA